nr:regulatory protein RecX [Nanchangia anserum]
MRTKLRERGYRSEVIETVLTRLVEVGIVNDRAYAEALARTRFRDRGLTGPALVAELRKKHVDEQLIGPACKQIETEEAAERARELARKKMATCRGFDRQRAWSRCSSYLARRGYAPSLVREAVSTAWDEITDTLDE